MAKTKEKVKPKLKKTLDVVEIHYIKTHSYRTYFADGVFGGLTPTGKLYMEFFLHRAVTPQVIKYKITPEGAISKEEAERIGKTGIVRQIEAGIEMDIETAKVLREWLDNKISESGEKSSQKK
jgi:hypothetical protein